jgi:pyridoxamine 5'-phosphate oxidase
MSLHALRVNYRWGVLDECTVAGDPLQQLTRWLDEARAAEATSWFEVNAMTLATVDQDGRVHARIVLLKGIDEQGLTFFSNYDSDKGRELQAHPQAALVLYWPHVERQVRIEGTVRPISRSESEAYFASRPRESQLGAHVSRQSRPVAGRHELERELAALQSKFAGRDVPCPDHWGGYRLTADRVEFWQGREHRLHDRIDFRRAEEGAWRVSRLAP